MFEWLAARKKKKANPIVQIEFDDSKEITNAITRKVGWPTVLYYTIFYWHSLFFLWRRKSSFDIIHAHTMEWSAIVASKLGDKLKKPVLIKDSTMNGFESLKRFPNGSTLQQKIINSAYFVAMTEIIKTNLVTAGVPLSKISLIPNGILIKQTITRKPSGQKVLFVGNLYQQPAKGIDILLKAWTDVIAIFPKAQLLIVGDGDLESYKVFAGKLGIEKNVIFLGKQNTVSEYYQSADLFVLPSRREGMSNALMEAMMYELPSIATNISGSQDLIQNGEDGILIPPFDVQALAQAICTLLKDPESAKKMGENARSKLLAKFTIQHSAEKYIEIYKKLKDRN